MEATSHSQETLGFVPTRLNGVHKAQSYKKSTPKMSEEEFQRVKASFLKQFSNVAKLRSIPESLIINIDQTGIKLVPTGEWTMAGSGSKSVEVAGLGDKRQITEAFRSISGWNSFAHATPLPRQGQPLKPQVCIPRWLGCISQSQSLGK